jgi:hypothetical protein
MEEQHHLPLRSPPLTRPRSLTRPSHSLSSETNYTYNFTMAEATTASSSNPGKPKPEGTSQRKNSKFQFIAPLKPEKGEGRGSALEWIDTVPAWFAFIALMLPVFASSTLYLWADENDNTYPVPGTVSVVKDAV